MENDLVPNAHTLLQLLVEFGAHIIIALVDIVASHSFKPTIQVNSLYKSLNQPYWQLQPMHICLADKQ